MIDKTGCAAFIIVIIIALSISVLITGGLIAIACWAFGWTFSWKIAIGIYAIICLISLVFGGSKN